MAKPSFFIASEQFHNDVKDLFNVLLLDSFPVLITIVLCFPISLVALATNGFDIDDVADGCPTDKSDNPFAYFTQIIYYAFIRRIQKEKKQTIIKQKLIMKSGLDEIVSQEADNTEYQNAYADFLRKNMIEIEPDKPKQKKPRKKKVSKLEYFM